MKTVLSSSRASTWTERRQLLPAGVVYLFSLDAQLNPQQYRWQSPLWTFSKEPGPAEVSQKIGDLGYLWAASSVNVDGVLRVPPSGGVRRATCSIGRPTPYGGMRARGDFTIGLAENDELLRITYEGVFSPRGALHPRPQDRGPMLDGTIFFASTQECAVPDLRWLTRLQLFSVARVRSVETDRMDLLDGWSLAVECDFYADSRRLEVQVDGELVWR